MAHWGFKIKTGAKALFARGTTMIHSNKPTKIDHLQWRTNAPLTEAETLEVENSLAWALANVVTQNPADLSDERIQSYKVALAPHKKLPPEVLAIIFLYCVQPPIILPPSPHEPALILVSICSSWRNLLLHIPDLWSNIFLDFNRSGAKSMKLLEFSKLWLSRSETSLITIRNSTSRWSERFLSDGNVNPIRYLVTPYITRCREIDLRFLEASIDEFFTLPKGSIEHLEVLYLETGGFSMPFIQGSGETLDVFRSAPRLRRVLFSTDLCSFDPHVLGLPWGQLTGLHFIATYIPPMAMHAILRQSHSLIECSCSIIELNNDVSAALEQLHECVLPSLRSLMVEFAPETVNYAPFLRPLVLPSLKDLELRPLEAGRLPECTWSQRAYAGLLSRSAFTLRRLAILHYVVSPTDIEAIFRGMPSLVDLHLFLYEKVEWDKAILDMLAAGELLPKLQILTFSMYPFDTLMQALETRIQNGMEGDIALLKRLNMSVDGPSSITPGMKARFIALGLGDRRPSCRIFTHTRAYAHDRPHAHLDLTL